MPRSRSSRTTDIIEKGYRGPVRLPISDGLDNRVVHQNITYLVTLSTNASGVFSSLIGTTGVTLSNDWASFANVYQEYRVNAMEVMYEPKYNASQSTLLHFAGATASSHDGAATAPPSLDAVVQHATWKPIRSSSPYKIHWRARGAEEMQYISTTTTSANGGLLAYIDALTASTAYGVLYITFNVAFKGRK